MSAWFSQRIVMLDVESTGIDDDARIVQMACVIGVEGKVVFERSTLINPGVPIPPAATEVHGITDEMVADARPFSDLADAVVTRILSGAPAAYHATYDRSMFARELARCDRKIPDVGWIDPCVWVKQVDKYQRGKKLTDACVRRRIPIQAHDALGDARAALRLLYALREAMPEDLETLLSTQEEMRAEQEAEFQAYRLRKAASGQ